MKTNTLTAIIRQKVTEEIGQALVELALILPMFLLLLLGAVAVGRLAYASIEVGNAARAGASYAAQNHTTASDTTNISLAATQQAPNITSLSATTSYSCTCESISGTVTSFSSCSKTITNLTTCPSPSRIVETVQVNTSAPVDTAFRFPLLGIPSSITLQGQAIMRVEQ
jgi:Flp pilus assembly protein TadG